MTHQFTRPYPIQSDAPLDCHHLFPAYIRGSLPTDCSLSLPPQGGPILLFPRYPNLPSPTEIKGSRPSLTLSKHSTNRHNELHFVEGSPGPPNLSQM